MNVEHLEHLSTLPITQFVCTLGVTIHTHRGLRRTLRADRVWLEPRLLPGAMEPSNEEVKRYFQTYDVQA